MQGPQYLPRLQSHIRSKAAVLCTLAAPENDTVDDRCIHIYIYIYIYPD